MKNLPFNNPFIPYYDNSVENVAPNPTFLQNDDAISSSIPYFQEKNISDLSQDDQIKVCYEIGNNIEIENPAEFAIEDSIIDSIDFFVDDDLMM